MTLWDRGQNFNTLICYKEGSQGNFSWFREQRKIQNNVINNLPKTHNFFTDLLAMKSTLNRLTFVVIGTRRGEEEASRTAEGETQKAPTKLQSPEPTNTKRSTSNGHPNWTSPAKNPDIGTTWCVYIVMKEWCTQAFLWWAEGFCGYEICTSVVFGGHL